MSSHEREQGSEHDEKQQQIKLNGRGLVLILIVFFVFVPQCDAWIKFNCAVKLWHFQNEPILASLWHELGIVTAHVGKFSVKFALKEKNQTSINKMANFPKDLY